MCTIFNNRTTAPRAIQSFADFGQIIRQQEATLCGGTDTASGIMYLLSKLNETMDLVYDAKQWTVLFATTHSQEAELRLPIVERHMENLTLRDMEGQWELYTVKMHVPVPRSHHSDKPTIQKLRQSLAKRRDLQYVRQTTVDAQ